MAQRVRGLMCHAQPRVDARVSELSPSVRNAGAVALGLIDHRKWNSKEFLLAGYPLSGQVKAGTTLTVERHISVRARAAKADR